MIPDISNSDGLPSIWVPLFLMNITTATKKLWEDLKRKKSDQMENNSAIFMIKSEGLKKC